MTRTLGAGQRLFWSSLQRHVLLASIVCTTVAGGASAAATVGTERSSPSWASLLEEAAVIEFSMGTVSGIATVRGRVNLYPRGERMISTSVRQGDAVQPIALVLCNRMLLGDLDAFRNEGSRSRISMQIAEAEWMASVRALNTEHLAEGLEQAAFQLPEPGQEHAVPLEKPWQFGEERFLVSIRRGVQGELSVRMVKTDHTVHPLGTGKRQVNVTDGEVFAEKSELAPVGSWNEMVISGDRQRAWLPATTSVRGWSAIGGGQFHNVGQARRGRRGCSGLPDSPVWPFQ